ncbi:MAG: response regulator transcription factor [Synergistaceae bacterium]|nr:response regulator transcription factor [Synergistaceae bacterium]
MVEDDDNIRDMLVYAMTSASFEAFGFADGEVFFVQTRTAVPSLVLLDIMLPGDDGLSILKKLKASNRTAEIPVIMLTAKGSEHDRIKGLDLGADDYITKPFSVMEVIARVRAVLRRSASEGKGKSSGENMEIAGIVLNNPRRTVHAGGSEITLTYKEFELLYYLMMNEGIVLSREKLLDQVWGVDYCGESRTVDMHVKSLRQKLGEAGAVIKTVRNVGYKVGK